MIWCRNIKPCFTRENLCKSRIPRCLPQWLTCCQVYPNYSNSFKINWLIFRSQGRLKASLGQRLNHCWIEKTAAARADAVISHVLLLASLINKGLDLRLGLNNHLININYHQKIYLYCLFPIIHLINDEVVYSGIWRNIFVFRTAKLQPCSCMELWKIYRLFCRNCRFFCPKTCLKMTWILQNILKINRIKLQIHICEVLSDFEDNHQPSRGAIMIDLPPCHCYYFGCDYLSLTIVMLLPALCALNCGAYWHCTVAIPEVNCPGLVTHTS